MLNAYLLAVQADRVLKSLRFADHNTKATLEHNAQLRSIHNHIKQAMEDLKILQEYLKEQKAETVA